MIHLGDSRQEGKGDRGNVEAVGMIWGGITEKATALQGPSRRVRETALLLTRNEARVWMPSRFYVALAMDSSCASVQFAIGIQE